MPKEGKLRGRMSSYAFFVQTCREEHKKKHPGESVVFAEFSKKCSEKWKAMSAKEKTRFEDMAMKDKARYDKEVLTMPAGAKGGKGGKRKKKDPNAPKRNLSGFFFFCNEERPKVKAVFPGHTVGDIAKELGKRWEACPNRPKFEAMAVKDKTRYEKEKAAYLAGVGAGNGAAGAKKAKAAPKAAEPEEDDDDDDDDEDEEEDESE
jgi:hypothetical protein